MFLTPGSSAYCWPCEAFPGEQAQAWRDGKKWDLLCWSISQIRKLFSASSGSFGKPTEIFNHSYGKNSSPLSIQLLSKQYGILKSLPWMKIACCWKPRQEFSAL